MAGHLKIIIDWDGTLTAEETQVTALAEKSLDTLARDIVAASRERLATDYQATRRVCRGILVSAVDETGRA